MNIIKCSNGHFFDSDRFKDCPNCQRRAELGKSNDNHKIFNLKDKRKKTELNDLDNEISVGSTWIAPSDSSSSGFYGNSFSDSIQTDDQAMGYFTPDNSPMTEPVVGWLVCTKGFYKGNSYELHCGANSVGRNQSNDIALPIDMSLASDTCFTITFAPQSRKFYIMLGKSGSSITVGNQSLSRTIEISSGDSITCGESKFTFIAFCNSDFMWEE